MVEAELSAADSIDAPFVNPYTVGDRVMLLRPDRRQKCQSPYEPGWVVLRVISPSSVRVSRDVDGHQEKSVNVNLMKLDPSVPDLVEPQQNVPAVLLDLPRHQYGLRDRQTLQKPSR